MSCGLHGDLNALIRPQELRKATRPPSLICIRKQVFPQPHSLFCQTTCFILNSLLSRLRVKIFTCLFFPLFSPFISNQWSSSINCTVAIFFLSILSPPPPINYHCDQKYHLSDGTNEKNMRLTERKIK